MDFIRSRAKLICPFMLLLLWQGLCWIGFLDQSRIPSPADVLRAINELLSAGLPAGSKLVSHCAYSLIRVGSGFLLAAVVAVPLGIAAGWSKFLRETLNPIIEIIRPIPPLAWIPLAILWFGIGLQSAAFIIFLGCFFPILLSTVTGVTSVDRILIDAARTLGAQDRDIFFRVLLPGAIPSIFTGFRIGLGIGWMTLVAAEFTGVKSGFGLGYMIMTARDIQRPDLVIAGMAIIGLIGFMLDAVIRMLENRLLRWR